MTLRKHRVSFQISMRLKEWPPVMLWSSLLQTVSFRSRRCEIDCHGAFNPPGTHYPISLYAIERGIHVLVTKPATKLLSHHKELISAARKHNVVCFVEHHKRFDPVYSDAKAKAQALGEFNFFSAWMSQPKSQLGTFKAWAGKDSDIRSVVIKVTRYSKSDICPATICHLITLISVVGSCRARPCQLALLRALRQG